MCFILFAATCRKIKSALDSQSKNVPIQHFLGKCVCGGLPPDPLAVYSNHLTQAVIIHWKLYEGGPLEEL